MRKSKHYRPDVIMARVIFGVVGVALIAGIALLVSVFVKPSGEPSDTQNSQNQNTEQFQDPEVDVSVDTESESDAEEIVYYIRTTAAVRFRSEPSTDSTAHGQLPEGTKALLIEELAGWYHIEYQGEEGYVSADYAVIEEGTSEEEPQASANTYLVVLDPGHQKDGDSELEPNGPDSSEMKARVTEGTTGVSTGVDEYILNLEISLMLRDELESRGYQVIMTRETHDVNISNMERAIFANEKNADITVRVHGNSYADSSVHGAETMAPSTSNKYAGDIAEDSQRLSRCVVNAYCEATSMSNRGVQIVDNMTGINWCEMPVTIIELGFMSNPTDDTNMQDDAFQKKMVQGIANGIDAYFGL